MKQRTQSTLCRLYSKVLARNNINRRHCQALMHLMFANLSSHYKSYAGNAAAAAQSVLEDTNEGTDGAYISHLVQLKSYCVVADTDR